MTRHIVRQFWGILLWSGLASVVLGASCVGYDAPRAVMHAPHTQIWGVALLKSHPNYRVSALTRMNGGPPLSEGPTVQIASGSDGDWQWVVKAAPSVVPEWKAWRANKRVIRDRALAERTGNWSHAATGWSLAFGRAHRVARYLLGHQPPALHATLLLVPDGVSYGRRVTRDGAHFFPLTLAFYWPSSGQLKQFAGLMKAVTRTVYEYQHLLVDSRTISPMGKSKADKSTNDEARSQCWYASTVLAIEAGTPATMQWNLSRARAAMALLQKGAQYKVSSGEKGKKAAPEHGQGQIKFSDAYFWGQFYATKSLVDYLQLRGVRGSNVVANKPSEMNDVMSVCRAMTQHPLDLTATNGYPPSRVQYVPFFPANLKAPKAAATSSPK